MTSAVVTLADLDSLRRHGDVAEARDVFAEFKRAGKVASLGWPDDVLEQFVFDHGRKHGFQAAYGHLDLMKLTWSTRSFTAEELVGVRHGTYFDHVVETRRNPRHWIGNWHGSGVDLGWDTIGTWRRLPVFIDGRCSVPPHDGLQVVEGHTRLGILQGLVHDGSLAPESVHTAWWGQAARS